ncbi:hypothetical protein GCM10008090_33820 [Arenicella chitinivorans]|uniref:Uncharacterized protein n=1 Tax=Arenicella chitinivorans TaxID=1329800 RepID=A0A918S233_9GAMM|nr:hypothetical protein GCM10008090_33820 [Arenicella chitinivorans]
MRMSRRLRRGFCNPELIEIFGDGFLLRPRILLLLPDELDMVNLLLINAVTDDRVHER